MELNGILAQNLRFSTKLVKSSGKPNEIIDNGCGPTPQPSQASQASQAASLARQRPPEASRSLQL